MDVMAKVIPGFVALILLISSYFLWVVYRHSGFQPATLIAFIAPAILPIIIIFLYCQMVVSINVEKYSLTIERRNYKQVVILFSDIKSIQQIPNEDMRFSVRTFGNGGMFGYTGKYYNRKQGSMTWYCTQRKNYIMIEKNDGKKIVFTPDLPNEFLSEVKKMNSGF